MYFSLATSQPSRILSAYLELNLIRGCDRFSTRLTNRKRREDRRVQCAPRIKSRKSTLPFVLPSILRLYVAERKLRDGWFNRSRNAFHWTNRTIPTCRRTEPIHPFKVVTYSGLQIEEVDGESCSVAAVDSSSGFCHSTNTITTYYCRFLYMLLKILNITIFHKGKSDYSWYVLLVAKSKKR